MPRNLNGDINDYLLQLWSTQLEHPRLGSKDDFFQAGGSSMQVVEMLTTVSEEFGTEIDYAEFFKNPCVDKLAQLLRAGT